MTNNLLSAFSGYLFSDALFIQDRFNDNLLIMKNLCESLKILARRALDDANDDSCRALYNDILKESDSFLQELESEIEAHKNKGKWE